MTRQNLIVWTVFWLPAAVLPLTARGQQVLPPAVELLRAAPRKATPQDAADPRANPPATPQAAGATGPESPARDDDPPQVEATSEPIPTQASAEEDREDAPETPVPAAKPPQQLTPEMTRLRHNILQVLSHHYQEPIYTYRHSPWGIMHAMHAFGVETEVSDGARRVNAAGWLCWNQPCRGRTFMHLGRNRELLLRVGDTFQGHEGQLLAMLAQSRIRSEFELRVEDRRFAIDDLVRYEQQSCKPRSELTFQLIGLVHYLGPNASWSNRYGQWSIPRLMQEEMRQPVIGAACGGTHRLMAQSYALSRARKNRVPLEGTWKQASDWTRMYQRRAFQLRNHDGSFSTNWFEGRGVSDDIDRRLQTSGHILEWLVFSLSEADLENPAVVQSVNYLTSLMLSHRNKEWEIGPRGHALRALALYDQRVFGGQPGQLKQRMATLLDNPQR